MNNFQSSDNSISEVEAIYKIVLRNLQHHNYAQLFSEAKPVIIQEAQNLLICSQLSTTQKQLLFDSLKLLKLENNQIILKIADGFPTEKDNFNNFKAS